MKLKKIIFQEIRHQGKIMQINPLIKELFYLRGKISPTMIEKISLRVKLHNNEEKSGSEIRRKYRK